MTRRWTLGGTRSAVATFLSTEASGGIVLFVAAVVGMGWANLGGASYEDFWHLTLRAAGVARDLRHWVNDGLMTVFFFVMGVEIKREFVTGELRDRRVAALPTIAAVGGMIIPAGVYVLVAGGGEAAAGWAIPMATDIAFVVGALALIRTRAPQGLRVFLLTLAIVDDVGAILVIAIFYAHGIEFLWLAVTGWALALLLLLRLLHVSHPLPYLAAGIVAWASMVPSGVHPTIAGVAVGLLVPGQQIGGRDLLQDLEKWLHPVSSYFVLPVFALANAGLALSRDSVRLALTSRVFWAIAIGLLVGKTVGIAGTAWLARRFRLGRAPSDVTSRDLFGGAALAGIGFTVSLFIAGLAFADGPLADQARLGILAGSLASAVCGGLALASNGRNGSRSRSAAVLRRLQDTFSVVLALGAVVWLVQGLRFAVAGAHSITGHVVAVLFVLGTFLVLVRVALWSAVQERTPRRRALAVRRSGHSVQATKGRRQGPPSTDPRPRAKPTDD